MKASKTAYKKRSSDVSGGVYVGSDYSKNGFYARSDLHMHTELILGQLTGLVLRSGPRWKLLPPCIITYNDPHRKSKQCIAQRDTVHTEAGLERPMQRHPFWFLLFLPTMWSLASFKLYFFSCFLRDRPLDDDFSSWAPRSISCLKNFSSCIYPWPHTLLSLSPSHDPKADFWSRLWTGHEKSSP